MANAIGAPLLLSTPDSPFSTDRLPDHPQRRQLVSDQDIYTVYEVERTAADIRRGKWTTVALQFPDDMLPHAPAVFEALNSILNASCPRSPGLHGTVGHAASGATAEKVPSGLPSVRLYVLADTSYGSCCVDEVAAEHINADVIVHYGRACLSPTARLPVIYVFTRQVLPIEPVVRLFQETFPHRHEKVIFMADVTYSSHLPDLYRAITRLGYANVYTTDVVHDPSSPVPNRTVPHDVAADPVKLKQWHLFHISDPPPSLLLILSSRVASMHIFPTLKDPSAIPPKPLAEATALALRRRYALLTSVSSVPTFGILVNTLSVKDYLHVVEAIKQQISAAGKSSYVFVVGKLNAAKLANFSEIGAWVIVGCWESSLVDGKDFWKPILTPFELSLALKKDYERVWTGEWISDFGRLLIEPQSLSPKTLSNNTPSSIGQDDSNKGPSSKDRDVDMESVPPEFNLRTGRYSSDATPLQSTTTASSHGGTYHDPPPLPSKTMILSPEKTVAVIRGQPSSGADYLKSGRTWQGLGSDAEFTSESSGQSSPAIPASIEEGRTGIPRGYSTSGTTRR